MLPCEEYTIQDIICQFLQENVVGKCVKGLTKIQRDSIHSLSLICLAGHLDTGDQGGQTGPAFHEPVIAGPDLVVLQVLCDGTQDDLFHNLAWHSGQADRPGIP